METQELKPCPFCGGAGVMHHAEFIAEYSKSNDKLPKDARIIREYKQPGQKEWSVEFRRKAYVPQCSDPSCVGRCVKMYKTEQEAIAAWNRRAERGD